MDSLPEEKAPGVNLWLMDWKTIMRVALWILVLGLIIYIPWFIDDIILDVREWEEMEVTPEEGRINPCELSDVQKREIFQLTGKHFACPISI